MKGRLARSSRQRLWLAALSLMACAQVVGIEDADLDPELTADQAGAGGEAGGSAGGEAGGGAGGEPSLCESFCDLVQETCQDEFQVYESVASCLAVCGFLPEGEPDDASGNSVYCRMHSAALIHDIGEPEFHCPAAGPGGNGLCGDNCEGFCTIMEGACPDFYTDRDECTADCPEDLGGFDISQRAGDTMQCRLYHVSAATLGPTTHCPHARGASPCE